MSVVPNTMNYRKLPPSVPARKRTRRFQPTNGDKFSPSGTSVIRIPIRDENYLDGKNSYLKFDLTNNNATDLRLDPNANSVFTRVRVMIGGVLAEDIERVNVLSNMLTISQGSEDYNKTLQIVSGQSSTDADQADIIGRSIPAGTTVTLCTSVFSGLLNCGKYLPLGLFKTNAITLELYLEQSQFVGTSTAVTLGYSLSNVEYIASLIEIQDDSTNKALEAQMMSTGIDFHGTTYTAHINNLAADANSGSINIPERCQSLKALITVVRPSDTDITTSSIQTRYPHIDAGNPFSWYYRIGSENVPQVAVSSSSESFLEFQKTYNHLFSLNQSTYCNGNRWVEAWDASVGAGCFSMTVSTEAFSHTDSMESGLDTASSAIPISLQLQGINLTGHPAEVISWGYKDVVWRFDGTGQFQVIV